MHLPVSKPVAQAAALGLVATFVESTSMQAQEAVIASWKDATKPGTSGGFVASTRGPQSPGG